MLNAGILTFHEFAMREQLPLATIQEAILDFLQNRDDVVIFGAQAVNAWVSEPRMTQDIDLVSTRAEELAEEIRSYLSDRFHIAVRVREVKTGLGYRVFQIQKVGNRHLVDLRMVVELPLSKRIQQVLVMAPDELVAWKVMAYHSRRGKPKAGTDWRDIAMLLLTFPELKVSAGKVRDRLLAAQASAEMLQVWEQLVVSVIEPIGEDDDF
jgi:Nucleotidyl transferase AbiEii toxin, Type IV TA system